MPAQSKAQQQAAGIALAAKRGDIPKSKLKGASASMAKMGSGELKKFAKTKSSSLPKHVAEARKTTFKDICRAGAAVRCLKGGQRMKDVAASAGKPPGTVRRWVGKAGFKKKGDQWRHVSEARAQRIVAALLEDEGQSDYEQYRMLQEKMRQMGAAKMGTPEFRQLWQQSEAIKNRNGGMPPQPPTAPPKASFAPNPGYAA